MDNNFNYKDDGICFSKELLSFDEVNNINDELNYLYSIKSINGSLGKIIVDKYTSHVMQPTLSVRSINLLE